MKEKAYLVTVARNHKDWLNKAKGGITIAVLGKDYPSKDVIRQMLTVTLEKEMFKQHLPAGRSGNIKRTTLRKELKEQYVDFLDSVNNTRYIVKELKG